MRQYIRNQAPDYSGILVMKIRILQSIVGNDPTTGQSFSFGPDAEVEVSDALAKDLVRANYAIALETQKIERATSPTVNKEIRRK
jgi:hypothetical protein